MFLLMGSYIMYRSQGLPNFVIQNNPPLLWYIMFVYTIKYQFGDASDHSDWSSIEF